MVGGSKQSAQTYLQDAYETLLLGYAAGILDQAQDLIVSAHIALSPQAKSFVRECEAIGGAMLEHECDPVALRNGSLESVLHRLDDRYEDENKQACVSCAFPERVDLPEPLDMVVAMQRSKPSWKVVFPGLHAYDLELTCNRSSARFLKVDPSARAPHHSHAGTEITLVLKGAFADDTGDYRRGDLIVADERFEHAPAACPENGCVCLIVSTAPIRLKGFAAFLNPFLRK